MSVNPEKLFLYHYRLINILDLENGLWPQRHNTSLFKEYGVFQSGTEKPSFAPWNWNELDTPISSNPELLWNDPATFMEKMIKINNNQKPINHEYIKKMYENFS